MSWQETDKVTLRKEFVLQAIKEGSNISQLCKAYRVSRKTGYKWINRFHECGSKGLIDQPTLPNYSPRKISKAMVKNIIEIRQKHPRWGARKIQVILFRNKIKDVPAPSTIHKVLLKEGYLTPTRKTKLHLSRFEHEAPNHLWQADFKGHFAYEKGRCHPLTILDDHSRFSVMLKACKNEQGVTVKPIFIEAFQRYGLPDRINFDNGNPWGSLYDCARYTTLSKWIIRLGVKVSYSPPGTPQINGKDERFHRTLKTELLDFHYFKNISHIQKHFNEWRETYNLERPHEGIGMQVPSDRYHQSYRLYPQVLPEIEYSNDYKIKYPDMRGRLSFHGKQVFVGIPFAKEPLGIRETNKKGVFQIYFSHQKLGEIDLSLTPKNTITNLYSGKVKDL